MHDWSVYGWLVVLVREGNGQSMTCQCMACMVGWLVLGSESNATKRL
jgi:hypothetical protein